MEQHTKQNLKSMKVYRFQIKLAWEPFYFQLQCNLLNSFSGSEVDTLSLVSDSEVRLLTESCKDSLSELIIVIVQQFYHSFCYHCLVWSSTMNRTISPQVNNGI
jgi:hypothetical protein